MRLDVFYDLLCPFSFLAKRSLDLATARTGASPAVAYRPFMLHPEFPRAPHDFAAAFVAKYGEGGRVPMWDAVIERGRAVGIDYRFYDIQHGFNSVDGHRAVRRAGAEGRGEALLERLFSAFFEECRYLGDLDLLADLAGEVGCDEPAMRDYLRSDEDLNTIYRLSDEARRDPGVPGVPFHLVDGRPWRAAETGIAAYEALLSGRSAARDFPVT